MPKQPDSLRYKSDPNSVLSRSDYNALAQSARKVPYAMQGNFDADTAYYAGAFVDPASDVKLLEIVRRDPETPDENTLPDEDGAWKAQIIRIVREPEEGYKDPDKFNLPEELDQFVYVIVANKENGSGSKHITRLKWGDRYFGIKVDTWEDGVEVYAIVLPNGWAQNIMGYIWGDFEQVHETVQVVVTEAWNGADPSDESTHRFKVMNLARTVIPLGSGPYMFWGAGGAMFRATFCRELSAQSERHTELHDIDDPVYKLDWVECLPYGTPISVPPLTSFTSPPSSLIQDVATMYQELLPDNSAAIQSLNYPIM